MTDCISARPRRSTFRRMSVTQGTISSMAKEVVKPDTTLKNQKFQPQKQRSTVNRTKSPNSNNNNNNNNNNNKMSQIQELLIQASMYDSKKKYETRQEQKGNNKNRKRHGAMTAPHQVPRSVEPRLGTPDLATMSLQQQQQQQCDKVMIPTLQNLSECDTVTCEIKDPWPIHQREWMTASPVDMEEYESEGSSSASSFSANFTSSNDHICNEQDIIENLDSSFKIYSNQVRDLLENSGTATNLDKAIIQECRSLILHQSSLLNQLETLSAKKMTHSIQGKTSLEEEKQIEQDGLVTSLGKKWTNFTQLFQKAGVTEVTVNKHINEPNGVVAVVKGTGITKEPILFNEHIKKDNKDDWVFDTNYVLNITRKAKETKFTFSNDWMPDNSTKQCKFTQKDGIRCATKFGLFNRKHHCRKCGHIYCGAHSNNKLPLFENGDDTPITSRVCDGCFSTLVAEHIAK